MAKKSAQEAAPERKLTAKQQRFVEEYLIDNNATQAAIRAGYAPKHADTQAYQLLCKTPVRAKIDQARAKRSERTEITQDAVLKRWWDIATANPNDLISYRRVNCRYCYGKDHAYQWIDEAEFNRCLAGWEEGEQETAPPTDDGGYGYDDTERPHPKCPKCHGEGFGEVFVHDTRDVNITTLPLYAGVKQTKDGLEIKMHDQLAALNMVARHLGMLNDKLTLKGDAENPLIALIKQVSGNTLKPVEDDQ
ncbi:terminase small subunit [Agrobacterium tumefaciens]|uniref:terminase small subunit n=1 Tax=Agrobacterium tumefaciens TaxID=358 RepID=UPI0015716360|nr:terminase small subunit [Agrobacterium tumefaciens]